MAANITDLMDRVTDSTTGRPVIGALGASGKAIGAPSITLADATNWTTTTAIHFSIYKTQVVAGVTVKDPTTQTDWKGTLSGLTISNLTITGGNDRAYVAGDIVELTPTARLQKDLYDLLSTLFNQDASLKPAPIQTALNLGSSALNGWNPLAYTPNTVAYNGNRSYTMTFNATDLTGTISPGMRLRTTRTVAAPTQCTSLNGTNQYFSKASPAGMTFTGNFTLSAWVKMTSYSATTSAIISRDATTSSGSGFELGVVASNGCVNVFWRNGTGNSSYTTYQSLPLNKWVHVAASATVASGAVIYFDGVSVPVSGINNATTLVQASNSLYIGNRSGSGSGFFPGSIAQAAIFSSALSQATIQGMISQGLSGSESTVVSAYSFNNSINDLNTTNANNLTANGSAVATNADSPFGGQAGGTISSTLDYAIVQSASFSTNTTVVVQVPEGCTIPTSGGVSAVAYSTQKAPFGMPIQKGKWCLDLLVMSSVSSSGTVAGTIYNPGGLNINLPSGEWKLDANLTVAVAPSGTTIDVTTAISPSASSIATGTRLFARNLPGQFTTSSTTVIPLFRNDSISLSTMTPYYLVVSQANAFSSLQIWGQITYLTAENAYL